MTNRTSPDAVTLQPTPVLADQDLLTPPLRPRLYEEVALQIVAYIRGARLGPGGRLPSERELAHRLMVSRTSVRQAVAALAARGVIDVRRGDGMYVLGVPDEMVRPPLRFPDTDVSDAKEAIEVKLAELAAVRRSTKDLAAMEGTIQDMKAEIEAGGIGEASARAFHAAVTRAARSSVLERLMDEFKAEFESARLICLEHPERPLRSLSHHQAIYEAIRDSNPSRASELMRQHLRVMADLSGTAARSGM